MRARTELVRGATHLPIVHAGDPGLPPELNISTATSKLGDTAAASKITLENQTVENATNLSFLRRHSHTRHDLDKMLVHSWTQLMLRGAHVTRNVGGESRCVLRL